MSCCLHNVYSNPNIIAIQKCIFIGFFADERVQRQQTRSGATATAVLPAVVNGDAGLAWFMAGLPIARRVNLM